MVSLLSALILCLLWTDKPEPHQGHIQQAFFEAGPIGTLRLQVLTPPHYSPQGHYPVLYACDGQNCFQKGQFGDWRLDDVAEELMQNHRIPDLIIVTVDHPEERLRYYTPRKAWNEGTVEGGDAPKLLETFREIQREIDHDFATDPDDTAILGSSLGGLFALYSGYSGAFQRVVAMSPSLWWAGQPGTGDLVPLTGRGPRKVWLDMGTAEGATHVERTQEMAAWLQTLGFGTEVECKAYPDARHHEEAWSRRLPEVLTWLYQKGP